MLRNVCVLFFLFPVCLFAQQADTLRLLRSVEIAYENDLLAVPINGRTDYYYTGGTFVEFNLPCLRKNPLSKILLELPGGRDESFGITVGNLGFTPTNIRSDSILLDDRPFSATLYIGFNRASCNPVKQLRLVSELDLGVIGPLAFGYETQKFIHAHTNNPEPHGWQFQVENDVYVNYFLRLEKGLLAKKRVVDVVAHGFMNAGTIYTNAGLGLTFCAGRMDHYFSAPGFSKRLQLWAYARTEGKVIARDATLQGGIFTNSVYVVAPENMRRSLLSETVGIVFAYKRIRVDYYNVFLGPEFKNGRKHAWGHLGVQVYF
jgi:hypothetical protein